MPRLYQIEKNASFKDNKQNIVLTLHYDPKKTDFFLINVTFEHLYNFSSVMILKSMDMFNEDEYMWSISLFDLDLITQYFSTPITFIHYIESRLRAPNFFAFDEISFLGYYLKQGNFTVYPIDGKIPTITITPEYLVQFDQYYLKGQEKPKLEIEDEIMEIIHTLEKISPENICRITNVILDLSHESRKQLIQGIQYSSTNTSIDGQRHDFSIINTILNTGITVFTQVGRENLQENLKTYCLLKKYQSKVNYWLGIGIDILDKTYYAHEFVYINMVWKYDKRNERALESAIKYKMIRNPEVKNESIIESLDLNLTM